MYILYGSLNVCKFIYALDGAPREWNNVIIIWKKGGIGAKII
jgi:hypothetical protein